MTTLDQDDLCDSQSVTMIVIIFVMTCAVAFTSHTQRTVLGAETTMSVIKSPSTLPLAVPIGNEIADSQSGKAPDRSVSHFISTLKQKAASLQGTWRGFQPAATTTSQSPKWMISADANSLCFTIDPPSTGMHGSTTEPTTLLDGTSKSAMCASLTKLLVDGSFVYNLASQERIREQQVIEGRIESFDDTALLLAVNVSPTSILHSNDIYLVAPKTINGVQYARLRYDPSRLNSVQHDSPSQPTTTQGIKTDFLFDQTKGVIAGISRTDQYGNGTWCMAIAWQELDNIVIFPSRIAQMAAVGGAPLDAIHPEVTDIAKAPGDGHAIIAAANDTRNRILFFTTPRDQILSSDSNVYNMPNGNLSDEVALVEAMFAKHEVRPALKQWDDLSNKIPDATERQRLTDVLAPVAAEAAWFTADHADVVDTNIAILKRLTDTLSNDQWRFISPKVAFAWSHLQAKELTIDQTQQLNGLILDRLAKCGNCSVLQALIQLAAKDAKFARLINPSLEKLVVHAGDADYQAYIISPVIAAAIAAGDFPRVANYLTLQSAAGRENKPVAKIIEIIRDDDHGRLISGWLNAAEHSWILLTTESGKDVASRAACNALITTVSTKIIDNYSAGGQSITADFVRTCDVSDPLSKEFWQAILRQLSGSQISQERVDHIAIPLARAIDSRIKSDCAFNTLVAAASSHRRSAAIVDRVACNRWLHEAFSAASNDTQRSQCVFLIATHFARLGDFRQSQHEIDALGPQITDPVQKGRLTAVAKRIQEVHSTEMAKADAINRARCLNGEIKYLQGSIASSGQPGDPQNGPNKMREMARSMQSQLDAIAN